MSPASSDSGSSDMFGSEEFGSGIDSGIGFEEATDDGMIGQTSNEAGLAAPAMPQRPIVQKGFTTQSFLLLISLFLMLTSAIMLFSYMGSIE